MATTTSSGNGGDGDDGDGGENDDPYTSEDPPVTDAPSATTTSPSDDWGNDNGDAIDDPEASPDTSEEPLYHEPTVPADTIRTISATASVQPSGGSSDPSIPPSATTHAPVSCRSNVPFSIVAPSSNEALHIAPDSPSSDSATLGSEREASNFVLDERCHLVSTSGDPMIAAYSADGEYDGFVSMDGTFDAEDACVCDIDGEDVISCVCDAIRVDFATVGQGALVLVPRGQPGRATIVELHAGRRRSRIFDWKDDYWSEHGNYDDIKRAVHECRHFPRGRLLVERVWVLEWSGFYLVLVQGGNEPGGHVNPDLVPRNYILYHRSRISRVSILSSCFDTECVSTSGASSSIGDTSASTDRGASGSASSTLGNSSSNAASLPAGSTSSAPLISPSAEPSSSESNEASLESLVPTATTGNVDSTTLVTETTSPLDIGETSPVSLSEPSPLATTSAIGGASIPEETIVNIPSYGVSIPSVPSESETTNTTLSIADPTSVLENLPLTSDVLGPTSVFESSSSGTDVLNSGSTSASQSFSSTADIPGPTSLFESVPLSSDVVQFSSASPIATDTSSALSVGELFPTSTSDLAIGASSSESPAPTIPVAIPDSVSIDQQITSETVRLPSTSTFTSETETSGLVVTSASLNQATDSIASVSAPNLGSTGLSPLLSLPETPTLLPSGSETTGDVSLPTSITTPEIPFISSTSDYFQSSATSEAEPTATTDTELPAGSTTVSVLFGFFSSCIIHHHDS
ncbi:hypothetical protein TI39_contig589g00007 [Zymoseptoria brevis]|uniref:Uncharacterized protein n=1 Tax=Zymoseptoria brevis TaxID=1047168 RepID=A0A0F4GID7_9PEZI|nr:hypothetical protein TI39_contig589g00007 [Zymoseptoria brevis]